MCLCDAYDTTCHDDDDDRAIANVIFLRTYIWFGIYLKQRTHFQCIW